MIESFIQTPLGGEIASIGGADDGGLGTVHTDGQTDEHHGNSATIRSKERIAR